jgi:hypothetical protein
MNEMFSLSAMRRENFFFVEREKFFPPKLDTLNNDSAACDHPSGKRLMGGAGMLFISTSHEFGSLPT